MGKADKHSARRRARVEETEEKWGGQTSTDPKQKTQPDGDEELCQYGLCGDTCVPLRWKDTKKARSLKKTWKQKDRVMLNIGCNVQKSDIHLKNCSPRVTDSTNSCLINSRTR